MQKVAHLKTAMMTKAIISAASSISMLPKFKFMVAPCSWFSLDHCGQYNKEHLFKFLTARLSVLFNAILMDKLSG